MGNKIIQIILNKITSQTSHHNQEVHRVTCSWRRDWAPGVGQGLRDTGPWDTGIIVEGASRSTRTRYLGHITLF